MPALEPAGLRTCFFASRLCWCKFPTSDLAHSLLHIEVQSYGQSGGSEMEALQEAYRQISSSAGECEDKRAEGSRTPLSLSTLQPASTVESGQTQLLANCSQSPSACLRFKPFDLLLFHRKCFQLCLKPKDVRFLALALFAAWVPLADSKQLDFVWGCHSDYFSLNLKVFYWRSVTLIEYEQRGWGTKLLPLAFLSNSFSHVFQCLVLAANPCKPCQRKNRIFVLFVNI